MAMIQINKNPSKRELLVFVVLLAGFLTLIGYFFQRGGAESVAAALWWSAPAVLIVGSALTAVAPAAVRCFYLGWIYAVMPIGLVVSYVVMAAIYFLVVTPIGLLLRAAGKDSMHRRFDRNAKSYWIERKSREGIEGYFRQF